MWQHFSSSPHSKNKKNKETNRKRERERKKRQINAGIRIFEFYYVVVEMVVGVTSKHYTQH